MGGQCAGQIGCPRPMGGGSLWNQPERGFKGNIFTTLLTRHVVSTKVPPLILAPIKGNSLGQSPHVLLQATASRSLHLHSLCRYPVPELGDRHSQELSNQGESLRPPKPLRIPSHFACFFRPPPTHLLLVTAPFNSRTLHEPSFFLTFHRNAVGQQLAKPSSTSIAKARASYLHCDGLKRALFYCGDGEVKRSVDLSIWAAAAANMGTMQQIGAPMPSHHGFLPASKEVVLEIQLNKLINDFLFSSVEDHKTTTMSDDNADGQNGSMHDNPSCPSWKMGDPSYPSHEMGNPSGNMNNLSYPSCAVGSLSYLSWGMGVSQPIPAIAEQNPSNVPTQMAAEGNGMLYNRNCERCPTSLPSREEIRLNVLQQETGFCDVDKASSPNKLKVLHLSKSYSEASSLFCFAVERRGHEEEGTKAERSATKLTRMGSLLCQSKPHSEAETEVKHTCRKPPRPPRSSSEKGPYSLLSRCPSETILVLHSSSRRAKLERRKKLAAASSSTASMWALIFTFCFAVAMIGEGFWSQGIHRLAMEASNNVTPADSYIESNNPASPMDTGVQKSLHDPGQLEKDMLMQAFWISKSLDPA